MKYSFASRIVSWNKELRSEIIICVPHPQASSKHIHTAPLTISVGLGGGLGIDLTVKPPRSPPCSQHNAAHNYIAHATPRRDARSGTCCTATLPTQGDPTPRSLQGTGHYVAGVFCAAATVLLAHLAQLFDATRGPSTASVSASGAPDCLVSTKYTHKHTPPARSVSHHTRAGEGEGSKPATHQSQ